MLIRTIGATDPVFLWHWRSWQTTWIL